MKLFIATSSLNIDNILSTECIAPLSFYNARNYGYNTFYGLDLIPFKNVLILFSKIPYFEIKDNEHDSRPIVLEVDIDEKTTPLTHIFENDTIHVYSLDSVLNLSPFNTRILFYNVNDLNHSRLSCSDSLTNKLGDHFKFDLCKGDFNLAYLSGLNIHVEDTCKNYDAKVLQNNKLNVVKGFILGFYLGISKSVSSDTAVLLKIQKRIYDIVATLKNNGGFGNSSFYQELKQLDTDFRKFDPSMRRCKEMWDNTLTELAIPSDALNKLLKLYDEENVLKTNFMKKNGLRSYVSLSQYGYDNIEAYRDSLKSYTSQIVKEDQIKQVSEFNVANTFDLDPTYETCMLTKDSQETMLFNKFIDTILWHGTAPTSDTLRTDRFNIATQITISAKNIWESLNRQWQGSPAQQFMNDLRQNIKSFTPLDVKKQDDPILKALAAFILKGEDFDAIVQFCEDNSYSDYSYSLALWGATIGYVKIPKPIIASITNLPSFGENYRAICTLLYNTESKGEWPFIQQPVEIKLNGVGAPVVNTDLRENVQSVINTLPHGQKRANEYCIESALQLEAAQGKFEAYLYILKNLISTRTNLYKEMKCVLSLPESRTHELSDVVKSVLKDFTTKSAKDYHDKALVALELENKVGEPVSFRCMLDDLNISKEIRDNLVAYFNIQAEESGIMRPIKKIGNFFGNLLSGQNSSTNVEQATKKPGVGKLPFKIENVDAIAAFIREINPGLNDSAYKQIINDLNWVFDPQYAAGKTEHEFLEKFHDKLVSGQRDPVSRNGKDMKWKNDAYRPIDIEKTISALKQRL
ncbi:MAG: hypothetical protein KBF13_04720 [Prevotella sp.]|nr:hypothetical protein [Prevotella sp.]